MEIETHKTLFDKSPKPTLYVVSKKVSLANRAAAKLFKRLGLDDPEGADFGKLWPKGTKASGKHGLTELKALERGEYGITLPDDTILAVETTPLSRKKPTRTIVTLEDATERKRAEEALQESEERYRVMAETALAGIWITDPDENMIFVNPALAEMLGYSEGELVGMNIARLTDEEGFSKYREGTQLRKKGIRNQYESTLKHKNGTTINVLVSASPLTGADGRYVATLGYVADITERKRAEEALRESEEFNRSVVEGSPLGISVRSRTGELLGVNEEWKRIWGISEKRLAEELAKEKDKLEFDKRDDYLGDWLPEVEKVYTEGVYLHIPEVELLVPKEGGACWVSHYFYPIKDAEEKVDRVVILTEDITGRKLAEEALQESEERYRVMAETALAGIWITDPDENVIFVNPALAEMLGYSDGELVGMNIAQLTDTEGFSKYREGTQLRKKGIRNQYESTLKNKDGTFINVLVSASPLTAADGTYEATLGYIADITERKLAEEALRESEERFKNIAENALEWIWEVDVGGKYTYVSPVVEQILGYKPEEVMGKYFYDLFHPEYREELKKTAFEVFGRKQPFREFLNRNVHKNGKTVWLSTSGVPVLDEKGNLIGYRGADTDVTARKLAEDELKASQEYTRNIIISSPDMIVSVDNDRRIVEFNEAAEDAFGYSKEEVLGKHIDILYADPEESKRISEAIRKTGKYIGEITNVRKNGESFTSNLSASLLRDSAGEIVGVMGVSRDITIERKATEALRESQQRFATLVEAALEGIGIVDTEENFIYTNTAFAETLGYSVEEIIEMDISQLVSAEQFDAILAETEKRKRGETSTYEVEFIHRDGSPVYFVVSVSPMFGRDGVYEGAYAVFLDITERKKAEEALQESEERYRSLLDTMNDGFGIQDEDGIITYVNDRFCDMFGYSREELIGRHTTELMLDDENEKILIEQTAKREKEKGEYYELSWKSKEGKDIHTMVSPAAILDPDGNFIGTSGVITDITDRKMAEEALRESEERYRAFTEEAIVGVYIYRGGRFYFVNKEMAAITGYSRDELLKISTDELVSPEDSEYLAEREKLRKKGDELPARYSMRIKRKDGEPAVLMVGSRPIQYGGETAYLGNCVDITENVRAQEALKSEKEKAQQYLDIAGVMLVVISADQRVRLINNKGCELLGYKEKEIIGENWFDLFVPANIREDMRGRFELLMAGEKKPEDEFENPVLTKDGKEPVILWHNTVLRDGTGEVSGVLSSGEDITERKLAEEALRESEERIRQFAETVPDILYKFNQRECVYDFLSPAFEKMTGYSLSEIHADPCDFQLKLVHPDDTVRIMKIVNDYAAGGPKDEPLVIETRLIRADGEVIWVRDSIIYEWDDEGLASVIGVMSDITERKRTDEALSKSEREKSAILENMSEFVVYIDKELSVIWANKAVADSLESAPDDLAGRKCYEMWFGRDRVCDDCHILAVFETGGRVKRERKLSDGRIYNITCDPVRDDSGEIVGAVEVSSDITERKRNEEALRESEVRFRRFTDTVTDMIYRFDLRRREYDFISPSCEVITGYTVNEFNADPKDLWDSLIHPEDIERVRKERDKQLTAGDLGDFYSLEYRIVRKGGEVVWVSEQGNFEVDEKGNIINFNGVVRSITERKRAEAALQDTLTKLQKSLRGTVSTISKIVETRDPYTSGHQTRVAELARSIAEKMGLSSKRIELIYMAALVHDIGKISVPQEILSKPTELTELEWNIIRTHPEVGCEILKNVEFPWPVTDVVIQHHERLDGSGYPQGVAGDDIMLEARILSVADVVEAMSSHRPYRPELGMHKALEEISDNKGVLYDDEAVNVCVNLFKRDGFSFIQTL